MHGLVVIATYISLTLMLVMYTCHNCNAEDKIVILMMETTDYLGLMTYYNLQLHMYIYVLD